MTSGEEEDGQRQWTAVRAVYFDLFTEQTRGSVEEKAVCVAVSLKIRLNRHP